MAKLNVSCKDYGLSPLSMQIHGDTPETLHAIVGSNPTQGLDVCVLWVLCVVR